MIVETGTETTTGIGAVRYRVTRLTSNGVGLPEGSTCSTESSVRVSLLTSITAVPEPSTYVLPGSGLIGLGAVTRRRAA